MELESRGLDFANLSPLKEEVLKPCLRLRHETKETYIIESNSIGDKYKTTEVKEGNRRKKWKEWRNFMNGTKKKPGDKDSRGRKSVETTVATYNIRTGSSIAALERVVLEVGRKKHRFLCSSGSTIVRKRSKGFKDRG